jgi:nucleoside-diphosphate-sugar epimerase
MTGPRAVLVTGGASGLGAASAARLRADGLTVTTLDLHGEADVIADVTDEAALRRVAGQIRAGQRPPAACSSRAPRRPRQPRLPARIRAGARPETTTMSH